jgi:broad specificity phosphatase PhoE
MTRNNKKIILGRHGQTVYNRDGFIQGQIDSPLTSSGIPEIKNLPPLARSHGPTIIYASALGRAAFTGSIYSKQLGAPIHFRQSIIELSCGIWEGMLRSHVKGASRTIRESWDDRPPQGESYRDAEYRVKSFIDEVIATPDHSTVLIIAHAGLNRVFLKLWLDLAAEQARMVRCPHDTLYLLEPDGAVRHMNTANDKVEGFLFEPD